MVSIGVTLAYLRQQVTLIYWRHRRTRRRSREDGWYSTARSTDIRTTSRRTGTSTVPASTRSTRCAICRLFTQTVALFWSESIDRPAAGTRVDRPTVWRHQTKLPPTSMSLVSFDVTLLISCISWSNDDDDDNDEYDDDDDDKDDNDDGCWWKWI